jgi:hypothetical protein
LFDKKRVVIQDLNMKNAPIIIFSVLLIFAIAVSGFVVVSYLQSKNDKASISIPKTELAAQAPKPAAQNEIKIISNAPKSTIFKSVNFESTDPQKPVVGTAALVQTSGETRLNFADSFDTKSDSKDFAVAVSKSPIAIDKPIDKAEIIELGMLQKPSGNQSFLVPATKVTTYNNSVVIFNKKTNQVYAVSVFK